MTAFAPDTLLHRARTLSSGLILVAIIALASEFVSEHYGAPAMLLALLFGISLNFMADNPATVPGIEFCAKTMLRLGVALLGLRISYEMVTSLGWPVIAMVVGLVIATISFGLILGRLLGFTRYFAVLTSGAVAICGASAAIAISSALPKRDDAEQLLVFTVVGVTVLSTVAMILYPVLSAALAFDDVTAGVYIGATIHDVAQVVGAGFSVSDQAGKTAILVKLLRVAMLAPVVVLVALAFRASATPPSGGERPPIVPGFLAAFILLAVLNSTVTLPPILLTFAIESSSWLLLAAIAAVGVKTQPASILKVGRNAVIMIVAQTLFLALVVLGLLTFFPIL